MTNIYKPSSIVVDEYLLKWKNNKDYVSSEEELNNLFQNIYPDNNNYGQVLIKCSALNYIYSTTIFDLSTLAKHIINNKIDKRLCNGDLNLINDVMYVKFNNGKVLGMYSFFTKYFAQHRPDIYPIYDYNVENCLKLFRKKDNFYSFKNEDLRDYVKFKNIIDKFKEYYCLEKYNYKEIDRYLWLLWMDIAADIKKKKENKDVF